MKPPVETFHQGSIRWGFAVETKGETLPLFTQVHGNQLIEIKSPEAHRATPRPADGGFSFEPAVEISVFTADCFPLLFFTRTAIAAVHSGWRGSLAGIPAQAVRKLGLEVQDYELVMGPALLACCFEVKEDFVAEFTAKGRNIEPYLERRNGKWYCHHDRFILEEDLKAFPPTKIHRHSSRCTFCSQPALPSYRRNKATDPRLRSWITREPT